MMLRIYCLAAIGLLCLGCRQSGPATSPAEPVVDRPPLRVLVVDDAPLAKVIEREWIAHAGGEMKVSQITESELLDRKMRRTASDVVIYRSALLGELATRDWIEWLNELDLAEPRFQYRDIFDLVRLHETHWEERPMAVPLGCPTLLLCYRQDIFDRLELKPPETWSDYQQLAVRLADRAEVGESAPPADQPWTGVSEPLASGWAGELLLCRAAAYARHRSQFSTLFDYRDLRPLIGGAPFVRALEELTAAARHFPQDHVDTTPAAAWEQLINGHCAMAITWPSPGSPAANPAAPASRIAFAPLPGSRDVYNFRTEAWERRALTESPRVPLLAISGRLGSITRECRDRAVALRFLFFLAGPEVSDKVSPESSHTTLFRAGHMAKAEKWVGSAIPGDAARQYAETVQLTLGETTCLLTLRIPGRQQYMAALEEAVHEAVAGQKTPQEVLARTARKWDEFTDAIGRDDQRKAYSRSIGLLP